MFFEHYTCFYGVPRMWLRISSPKYELAVDADVTKAFTWNFLWIGLVGCIHSNFIKHHLDARTTTVNSVPYWIAIGSQTWIAACQLISSISFSCYSIVVTLVSSQVVSSFTGAKCSSSVSNSINDIPKSPLFVYVGQNEVMTIRFWTALRKFKPAGLRSEA